MLSCFSAVFVGCGEQGVVCPPTVPVRCGIVRDGCIHCVKSLWGLELLHNRVARPVSRLFSDLFVKYFTQPGSVSLYVCTMYHIVVGKVCDNGGHVVGDTKRYIAIRSLTGSTCRQPKKALNLCRLNGRHSSGWGGGANEMQFWRWVKRKQHPVDVNVVPGFARGGLVKSSVPAWGGTKASH